MNNGVYSTEDRHDPTPQEVAARADNTAVTVALNKLLKSKEFQIVLEGIFRPRLEVATTTLKSDKDAIALYKAQGAVEELEYLINALPAHLQSLKNTIDHGTKETNRKGKGRGSAAG